jgi:two-component system sensor histidine kinase EvgS
MVAQMVVGKNFRHEPGNIMARDTFPFGSALMLKNSLMKSWLQEHYPHPSGNSFGKGRPPGCS